jgi:hypothetical protein
LLLLDEYTKIELYEGHMHTHLLYRECQSLILTCTSTTAILLDKQDRIPSSEFGHVPQFLEEFLHQSNDMVWENDGGYRFLHIANVWQLQHLAYVMLPDQPPHECVSRLEVPDVGGAWELTQVCWVEESDGLVLHVKCADFYFSHPQLDGAFRGYQRVRHLGATSAAPQHAINLPLTLDCVLHLITS